MIHFTFVSKPLSISRNFGRKDCKVFSEISGTMRSYFIFSEHAAVGDLPLKNQILEASLVDLCNSLDPRPVLKTLLAQEAITADDKQRIEKKCVTSDQVDELVNTLLKKPVEAYNCFMEHIKKEQSHVYEMVQANENQKREGKM